MRGKIHVGDCLEVMRSMPSESVRLVVTSPPYNLRLVGNSKAGGKWKNSKLLNGGYDMTDDALPHADYVAWQRDCISEMLRLLRPDGAIFYNHKWRIQKGFLQDRADVMAGFPVRQIIIWHRSGGIDFSRTYFLNTYEVIYLIAKPDFKLAPKKSGLGSVWRIHQETGKNPHPAPFPVKLPMRCIESVGEGPVLDPFMGSGSTAIAAEHLEIDWVGIEKSPTYAREAMERIKRETYFFTDELNQGSDA